MDPVTTAILSAIAAGASKAAGAALEDAYTALKTLIRSRYGRDSPLDTAIKRVEKKPSQTEKARLLQEIQTSGVDTDPMVLDAADNLLYYVQMQNYGQQYIQQAQRDINTISGQIVADRGSNVRIGGSDTTHNSISVGEHWFVPQTFLGWLIVLPGWAAFLIGFGIFGLTFTDLISNPPPPGADMPAEFGTAFRFALFGMIIVAIGGIIDRIISHFRR
jgi:hypothetical protein